MTIQLSIIVPSRGRPKAMAEFMQWHAHTTTGLSEVVCCLDEDDPELENYGKSGDGLRVVVGPRQSLAGWTNTMALELAGQRFAVASLGDDHRVEGAWETEVLDALHRMGTGIVYGDDGLQGQNTPTACFMTTDIVRALGWMCFPGADHMEIDVVWKLLGQGAECLRYLPHVSTPHLHPLAGKAEWDESYRESNSQASYNHDRMASYLFFITGQFNEAVAKIRATKNYQLTGHRQ